MNRIVLTTALILAAAAPAFANDQLAASIGVEPGVYSTAELVAIKSSYDTETGYVLPAPAGGVAMTDQLAASIGVDAGRFSVSELAAIKSSYDTENGFNLPAEGGIVSTQSVGISAGHQQLAANLGLNAGDFSVAELAAIKGAYDGTM